MSFRFYFRNLFTALILRPLLRDPFRTAITIFGVAVGVAVFLSIRLANQQTMMSFSESVGLVLGKSDAVIRVEGIDFDESVFKKLHILRSEIKAYPVIEGYGVETVSGELVADFEGRSSASETLERSLPPGVAPCNVFDASWE